MVTYSVLALFDWDGGEIDGSMCFFGMGGIGKNFEGPIYIFEWIIVQVNFLTHLCILWGFVCFNKMHY